MHATAPLKMHHTLWVPSFDDETFSSSSYFFTFPEPAANQGNSRQRKVMQIEPLNWILGWLVGAKICASSA